MNVKIRRRQEVKAVLFEKDRVCVKCAIEVGLTKKDIKGLPWFLVITGRDMELDGIDYIKCARCGESII
jgi:hypothetical protein